MSGRGVARVLVLAAALMGAGVLAHPGDRGGVYKVRVRSPEEVIRARMLEQTPLGTSKTEVLAFIRQRLRHVGEPEFSSYGARRVRHGAHQKDEWIGAHSIERLEVGKFGELIYLGLIKTHVYLSWAFDADDRLIEVVVYKETNSL